MAESATVGALRIILGIDAAEVETGGKRAVTALAKIETAIGASAGAMVGKLRNLALGFAAAFGVEAMASAIRATLNLADEHYKLAQSLGVSTEQLTRLQYAASLAGLEQEDLRKGINKLTQAFDEAKDRGSGVARAFAAIGLDANSAVIKNKDLIGTLEAMADRFSGAADGANKTAVTLELLGAKMGSKWIPLLNSGSQSMRDLGKESDALGRTLSTQTGKAAEEFNDTLTRSQAAMQVVYLKVIEKVLPNFQAYATILEESSKNTEKMNTWVTVLSGGIENVARALTGAIVGFGRFAAEVKAAKEWLSILFSSAPKEDVLAAWARFVAEGEKTRKAMQDLKATNDAVWGSWAPTVQKAVEEANKPQVRAIQTTEELRRAQQLFGETLVRNATLANPMIGSLTDMANVIDLVKAEQQDLSGLAASTMAPIKAALDSGKLKWEEYRAAAGAALNIQKQFNRDEFDAVMSEITSTVEQKMAAVNKAFDNGTLSFRAYGKAIKDVNKENEDAWLNTTQMASSAISTIFGRNKDAAIASAAINTAVGITRTFRDVPFPLNWVQAGLIAATGVAQIAQIRSQSESGGGSVSATSGGQGGAAAPAEAPQRVIHEVRGVNAGQWYEGGAIRDLMAAMVKEQRDGVEIVLA